ncbi:MULTISPECIES: cupredoxin domain-containing protein [Thermoleptolyngbya]|uniref:hypothetical protein n=1 Tax=Thermoleptolyngbya TaxID=2303528 RepID=UPI001CEC2BA2|nr:MULTISPECIES: hypothetical protein [Thermoleptolyngbya]
MAGKSFGEQNWGKRSVWQGVGAIPAESALRIALSGLLSGLLSVLLGGVLWLGVLTPQARAIASPANVGLVSEVQVQLGDASEALKFVPDHLEFTAGRKYKLVLDNPSSQKHYFTAKDFADSVWTQKVEAGNVEIKGAIHELELKPGAVAEWVFVPQRPGTYDLRCVIAGHAEAGMVGEIVITP